MTNRATVVRGVVTWRRAQMVVLSVQAMVLTGIAKVTFTSPDRMREVMCSLISSVWRPLAMSRAARPFVPGAACREEPLVCRIDPSVSDNHAASPLAHCAPLDIDKRQAR